MSGIAVVHPRTRAVTVTVSSHGRVVTLRGLDAFLRSPGG
ncbi:Uncharacterised protein [Mycobacteroides abscessus subsp. abscessus]|uniref:Uncharacterized protein n=1 Tax=Mycobacteroides abscessus 21 TaxID=1299324 RepID=A0A829Q9X2_9MYCO|nr:hypothetical protein I543_3052 [Mycobacteroides abscessus 21]SHY17874.1 Uncharacterised protein [Mycobacteroides abscessus subsp. abscessus]SIM81062.1 Uncharacterised protein [Mycobacteroides abscessus subsp. abscessus]SKY62210.1 Uncharacterised protein [Mycobacteroides abscessus subsp. abscessus]